MGFEIDAPLRDGGANIAVNLPSAAVAGFAAIMSEQDAGLITGVRRVKEVEVSEDFRIRAGLDSPFLQEQFPGAALNSAIWTAPTTTMTVVVGGGFVTLNAGLSVATTVVARVSSYRSFPIFATCETYFEIVGHVTQLPVANNVTEWGAGIATASAAPTDGAFFRLNASGIMQCVVTNNGVDNIPVAVDANDPILDGQSIVNISRHYCIALCDDCVKFWIDDKLVARIERAPAGSTMVSSAQLPVLMRTYNTAGTSAAQSLKVSLASVWVGDPLTGRTWADAMSGMGNIGAQGPTGGTMGSTALYTNSLAAGAGAAATNTTAALGSGLGGQFALQPTLAAGTDGIISSYQVPLGTAALPGRTLMLRGIKINGVVTTAFVGGPCLFAWSLAFGHTAVSLATAEGATTKAPRRIALGIQTFPVTAAVGARDDREISVQFMAPVPVQPGEFIQTVVKNLGTVTSAGVIIWIITPDTYWE